MARGDPSFAWAARIHGHAPQCLSGCHLAHGGALVIGALLSLGCLLLSGCGEEESSGFLTAPSDNETSTPAPAPATPTRSGKPGAPWSEVEVEAIKGTLWRIYDYNRGKFERTACALLGDDEYPCQLERMEPKVLENCDFPNITATARRVRLSCDDPTKVKVMTDGAIPSVAKFLRLGFHDCFKYEDGTGGCDGCMNFDKVFVIKNIDEPAPEGSNRRKADFPYDFTSSGNANLVMTADFLERIYTDVSWGYQSNLLTQSLQETGKSRADLWAFAAQVAVEWFLDQNNRLCESADPDHIHLYKEPTMNLPFECSIRPSRYMRFYTGRSDCLESQKPATKDRYRDFETAMPEVTANPHASGLQTVEFMRSQFGMSPRETVAVMGAHAVGTFHSTNAGFRYTWLGMELGQARMLNNLYYRVLAYKPLYLQGDLKTLHEHKEAGRPVPGPSRITHQLNPRNLCPGYGPVQWFMHTIADEDSNMANGGTHVTMLNTDIGLYLSFDVLEGGYPISTGAGHCTNLRTTGSGSHIFMSHEQAHATCLQTATAGGAKPLYQIVEEYAEDQNGWWDDFVAVIEKMPSNGYADGELLDNGIIRTTTATTPRPPPPPLSDCTKDHCCLGIKSNSVCCAWECGSCGGSRCLDRPGGRDKCCKNTIEDAGRHCANSSDVACIIP